MKKIIIIAVAVILLVVGGLAALTMLGKGPFADLAKQFEKSKDQKDEVVAVDSHERAFDLGTYIVPIVANHAIRRQIGMDLTVVVDVKAADKVSGDLPRLQNALLLDLFDFLPHHDDAHSADNREAIHQHLVRLANVVFGEGAVHDVVIKSLYDR